MSAATATSKVIRDVLVVQTYFCWDGRAKYEIHLAATRDRPDLPPDYHAKAKCRCQIVLTRSETLYESALQAEGALRRVTATASRAEWGGKAVLALEGMEVGSVDLPEPCAMDAVRRG